MKNISFTTLTLENFGIHKNLSVQFGNRTTIKGANEVGKSTIKRAIQYALNCRDENGKEITGIRPHDENGKDYEVDTTVQLGISVDGNETTLGKVFRRNFNKKGDFTGNVTDYSISDIPKRLKDYDEYIKEIIPSEICINAQAFLSLDTAHRRALLEQTFSTHTTDSIIDDNPEFEPIRELLKIGTIDELKKRCRVALNGDKNKKGLRDLLAEIPVRIDEVEKTMVDIDLAELELAKKVLLEKITENKAKQENTDKQFEEYDNLQKGILELQFALSDLERKANEGNTKKRKELQTELDKANTDYDLIGAAISGIKSRIKDDTERNLPLLEQELKQKQELWKSVNAEQIDEEKFVCPTCHRELPENEKENILSNFEQMKKQRLEFIVSDGEIASQKVKDKKKHIEDSKAEIIEKEKREDELLKQIDELEEMLKEIPLYTDISDTPEYKAIKAQIKEKETAMHKGNSAYEIRQELKREYEDLHERLREVEKQLASANNDEVDRRIDELHREQREIAQKIADQEKELDYIVRFERTKNRILERDINSNFEYVKFSLFELQLNGDFKDICTPLYLGESYDRNLNHGAKILAEIDICRAFQKSNGIVAPIICDDTESLDPDRVPDIENQIILLMRTDNNDLMVESEG